MKYYLVKIKHLEGNDDFDDQVERVSEIKCFTSLREAKSFARRKYFGCEKHYWRDGNVCTCSIFSIHEVNEKLLKKGKSNNV